MTSMIKSNKNDFAQNCGVQLALFLFLTKTDRQIRHCTDPNAMTDADDERYVTIELLEVRAKELQREAEVAKSEDDLGKVKNDIEELRQLLREGVEWWAQFDVRRGQILVEQTEREIDAAQQRVKPRRRFKFKSAATSKSSSKATTNATTSAKVSEKNEKSHDTAENGDDSKNVIQIIVSDIDQSQGAPESITVRRKTIEGRGVRISEGHGRNIIVEEGARSLWLVSLTKCIIDISDIDGPVWVLDCKNSIIRCKCRQLRVHRCHCCVLRTCVVGAPVLENCTDMKIGPLQRAPKDEEGQEEGRWKDVVDMSWLREGESANWRFVKDKEDDTAVLCSADDAAIS